MDSHHVLNNPNISYWDICLADSATTHTILGHNQYFSNIRMMKVKVNTISGSIDLIKSSRRADITLPNRTRFIIDNALFSLLNQWEIY